MEVTKTKSKDPSELPGELWTVSCKLHGIGELIKFHNGEPALNQDQVNLGIGEIITDLAEQIDNVREELESREYKPTRDKPPGWDAPSEENKESGDESG